MGNDERCCTRFRANAIFLSPASLLMEFMRSLRRSGSAREGGRRSVTRSKDSCAIALRTRDVVVHAGLQAALTIADH